MTQLYDDVLMGVLSSYSQEDIICISLDLIMQTLSEQQMA